MEPLYWESDESYEETRHKTQDEDHDEQECFCWEPSELGGHWDSLE
jgi:hypothetical protein